MAKVQPIKDTQKINDILTYLKKTNERNYILFLMGVTTGLRIGDILKLKVSDLKRDCKEIEIFEEKTGKLKYVEFNKEIMQELKMFIEDKESDQYLIESNRSKKGISRPITYTQAYRVLKQLQKDFNLRENIGTHTLRKSYAYHMYMNEGKDIAVVQEALNHSNAGVTIQYLGIGNQRVNEANKRLSFLKRH